jgi:hypothetical protein
MGLVVSTLAGLRVAAFGYASVVVGLLIVGPRDEVPRLAVTALLCLVPGVVGTPVRTWLVRGWMAAEDARRTAAGPGRDPR